MPITNDTFYLLFLFFSAVFSENLRRKFKPLNNRMYSLEGLKGRVEKNLLPICGKFVTCRGIRFPTLVYTINQAYLRYQVVHYVHVNIKKRTHNQRDHHTLSRIFQQLNAVMPLINRLNVNNYSATILL